MQQDRALFPSASLQSSSITRTNSPIGHDRHHIDRFKQRCHDGGPLVQRRRFDHQHPVKADAKLGGCHQASVRGTDQRQPTLSTERLGHDRHGQRPAPVPANSQACALLEAAPWKQRLERARHRQNALPRQIEWLQLLDQFGSQRRPFPLCCPRTCCRNRHPTSIEHMFASRNPIILSKPRVSDPQFRWSQPPVDLQVRARWAELNEIQANTSQPDRPLRIAGLATARFAIGDALEGPGNEQLDRFCTIEGRIDQAMARRDPQRCD